jgi:hypothetical protein
MDCRTPIAHSSIGGPGEPGGVLPAGTEPGQFLQFNGVLWVPSQWLLPLAVDAGDAGEVLTAIGDEAEFQDPLDDLLLYRNAAVAFDAATPWIAQWYAPVSLSSMNLAGFAIALRAGVLRWLRVTHSTPVLANEVLTYVVVVNGADTALTVSLNTNATGPASNLTTTVPVVVGDRISMRVDGVTASRAVRMGGDFFLD